MKKIKITKVYKGFSVDTSLMRNYNYITFNLGYVQIVAGRPFIPLINKGMDKYKQTRLYKIYLYYNTLKKQMDVDLMWNQTENHWARKQLIKRSFSFGMIIKENEPFVPKRIKTFIENHIDKLYERRNNMKK